jgi:predicted DNA-binding protein (MmcQ/YjbR family)
MDIESFRAICMALPDTTEDIKWTDHLCFSIGGKMYAVTGPNNFPVTASFKVTDEDFELLPERPGFKPAPYMARYKWIFTEDISLMSVHEWKEYLSKAYEATKAKLPKKILQTLKTK